MSRYNHHSIASRLNETHARVLARCCASPGIALAAVAAGARSGVQPQTETSSYAHLDEQVLLHYLLCLANEPLLQRLDLLNHLIRAGITALQLTPPAGPHDSTWSPQESAGRCLCVAQHSVHNSPTVLNLSNIQELALLLDSSCSYH